MVFDAAVFRHDLTLNGHDYYYRAFMSSCSTSLFTSILGNSFLDLNREIGATRIECFVVLMGGPTSFGRPTNQLRSSQHNLLATTSSS